MVEVLENVANSLAVNEEIGTEENFTVLLVEGNTSALLVERVSVDFKHDWCVTTFCFCCL